MLTLAMKNPNHSSAGSVFNLFFGFLPAVPDTAPTDVGGGGGTKSELVITWEVSHLSDFTATSASLG